MKVWTSASFLRILLGLGALMGICWLLLEPLFRVSGDFSPKAVFATESGLAVENDWQVIRAGRQHNTFNGDGETHVVLRVPQKAIDHLLSLPAPWSGGEWQRGPIPHEIGFHCGFGTSGVSSVLIDGNSAKYSGDAELAALLNSSQVAYVAKERCCESIRWHNGDLLIIDRDSGTLWLSMWDF